MLELFLSLYLQAAVLISGGTTTTDQSTTTQTTITQPATPINSSVKPVNISTNIGGGGWDDKN